MTGSARLMSARPSSSAAIVAMVTFMPPPPYFSDTVGAQSPISVMPSRISWGMPFSSISRQRGAIFFWAKSCTALRHIACSSVQPKSMPSSLKCYCQKAVRNAA